jgi:hypothetical protein
MSLRLATAAIALVVLTAVAAAAPDPKVLARERANAAQKVYTTYVSKLAAGASTAEAVCTWSVRWLDAELAAGTTAKTALEEHHARMEKLEKAMTKAAAAGTAPASEGDVASYFRLEAAVWVLNGSRS